ncbi:head GIN domain-containing protein [Sediminibacterium sp.]|uniref:head GIN domain-containing protein n=1 Tax=Sediminibacterium sp. TaxID=1917865 RepID=UPI003F6E76EB
MKKHLLLFLSIFLLVVGYAQDEKKLVFDANAQERKVGPFKGIEISGAINLYLSQGKEEAVAVSSSEAELIGKITTVVRNNTLYISLDTKGMSWKKWGNNQIKAYVTFTDLEKLEASGACNIRSAGKMRLSDLKLELSGASDFNGEIEAETIRIDLSGASQVTVKGTADKATYLASGASSIKAFDLAANYCKIDASGASSIRVFANKEISAEASGASSIQYKGDAVIKDFNSSGASSVKRKAD